MTILHNGCYGLPPIRFVKRLVAPLWGIHGHDHRRRWKSPWDSQRRRSISRCLEAVVDLVEPEPYVGEVYSLGYETALVQVHDFHRQKVGGIPALSFLLATRVAPSSDLDVRAEDSSVILLRVLDQADLPNAAEARRVRVENAQQVSGAIDKNWDHRYVMDASTAHVLS